MDPYAEQESQILRADPPPQSPRLRDYIWRPRFCKVWWGASCIHWSGMLLALMVQPLANYYNTTFAGCVGILLYPPFMFGVGCALLLRAKIICGDWVVTGAPDEFRFPRPSEGGLRDPYTDPLDPRSGSMYLRHAGFYDD